MKILLTGSSSYIGKNITSELVSHNYKVYGLSRTNPNIKSKNFIWIKKDINSKSLSNFNKKFDAIIHVAGTPIRNFFFTEDYIKKNILLTLNLKKIIKKTKAKLIIYLSSREIYGEVKTTILKEKNDIINPSVYGLTKYLGEKFLMDNCKTFSLRLPAVLGKGTHGWISKIYKKIISNKKIYFHDTKFNNCIHVSDLAKIVFTILKKPPKNSEVFNISSSLPTSSGKLIHFMKNKKKSSSVLRTLKPIKSYYISNKKISRLYKPMSTIKTIEKYLNEI